MFGVGTDLRCPKCAGQRRSVYSPPSRPILKVSGALTKLLIGVSAILFGLENLPLEQILGAQAPIPRPSFYLVCVRPRIWDGEVWRLVTSTLLHGDFLHILFNCYWLWRFGATVEAWMGKVRYLAFFIVVSVASMGAEVLFSNGAVIGLSGVVYGLFGLLYALRRTKDFAAQILDPMTVQVLVFWFFVCILLTASNSMPVANIAHGVGALAGWAIGWASLQPARNILVPAVAAVFLLVGLSSTTMPWNGDYCVYRALHAAARGDGEGFMRWRERSEHALVPPTRRLEFDEEG